ncbi:MAG: DUF2807 domain-containing protein [Bacteroidales bacterium]|nr:DUF2807 domain-containing protein [Bacteroidales bacterium]
MQKVPSIFLVFISLLLASCSKDVFFTNGPTVEEDRLVEGHFRFLEMHDNVNVRLVHRDRQDNPDLTPIHIETGENLIPKIRTAIHGDTLTIGNDNTLNWLRNYDYPLNVTVYYDSIYKITFDSNGDLVTDTLRGMVSHDEGNSLTTIRVNIIGGSGNLNLAVHCQRLHTNYEFGTACLTTKGSARIAYTTTNYNSHGPIDDLALETNIHYIYAYGTNDIKVKAFHEIQARNQNNGSIYYLKYIGKRWNYQTQSFDDVHCPEVVNSDGHNIFPIEQDQ